MRRKMLCLLASVAMVMMFFPILAFADSTGTTIYVDSVNGDDSQENVGSSASTAYKSIELAVNAAESGDTIQLAAGNYTLYQKGANVLNKDLTFIGAGSDKTTWAIGAEVPNPDLIGTEYNSDYSFDVRGTAAKETVTFKNMTLQAADVNYLGFAGSDNTVVDNCVINGKTFYWGYNSAKFTNSVFNAPNEDYAIWTYSSPEMTFDNCTFNSSGKTINVYSEGGPTGTDVIINYKDCTVNDSAGNKPVLNINDTRRGNYKYIINISGDNAVSGVKPDSISCSRLFGFSGRTTNNTGKTVVNIEGTTVWSDGQRAVDHACDISGGSYSNGYDSSDDNKYTDGYKDDNFAYDLSDLKDTNNGIKYQYGSKKCNYCGYQENVVLVFPYANKTLDGKAPSGNNFAFAIENEDGVELQRVNNEGANINFDSIEISQSGIYKFKEYEVAGEDKTIKYDDTVFTYEIEVTESGEAGYQVKSFCEKNGGEWDSTPVFQNMTKEDGNDPENPGNIDDSGNSDQTVNSPKTGDDSTMGLWITLTVTSLLILLVLVVRKIKVNK